MLNKPAHGAPCNSCGLCCINALCPVGEAQFGMRPGPCPAIMPQASGHVLCGLMADPARFAPEKVMRHGAAAVSGSVKMLNGSGEGCDCFMDDEEEDRAFSFYISLSGLLDAGSEDGLLARKMWGI
jgi:hypothetical protein